MQSHRHHLAGFRWLWAPGSPKPAIAAQRSRRRHAAGMIGVIAAAIVVAAMVGAQATEAARAPIILALLLMPAAGHSYIAIARRLIQPLEAMIVTAARAESSCAAALVEMAAATQGEHRQAVARVGLELVAARAAHRAGVDALRASARVSHAALAPRMTSRSLRSAA